MDEVHEFLRGGVMLAWLCARPAYCDRGRWHAVVEANVWRSDSDPWPRYYFDLERGKLEIEAYLKAKIINVEGAIWKCRRYVAGEPVADFEEER